MAGFDFVNGSSVGSGLSLSGTLADFVSASLKTEGQAGITYSSAILVTTGSNTPNSGSQLFFRNGLLISSSLKYGF